MTEPDHLAADDWSARCLDAIRPALGLDAYEKQWLRDQAERSIARIAQAERAARLLETITAHPVGPKVNAPRHLAGELRRLADDLEDAA